MAGICLHDLYTYGLTQRFLTTVTRPSTGTWSRSKWDQKSCQLSKFDSVLLGHGTKNANKPWHRDLRPKKLGTNGLTYQVTSPFDCKSSLFRWFWYWGIRYLDLYCMELKINCWFIRSKNWQKTQSLRKYSYQSFQASILAQGSLYSFC